VNLKKRIAFGVSAVMLGSIFAATAIETAGAAVTLPDYCGVYIQGNIDPRGGLLPSGAIPAPANINDPGQKAYVVTAHEAKGADKTVNDPNNATAGATRFQSGVTLGGNNGTVVQPPIAPTLAGGDVSLSPVGSTTSIKVLWKNDANGLGPKPPQIQVQEKNPATATSVIVAKGFVTGMAGGDNKGPVIGIKEQPPYGANTQYRLVTPNTAGGGTFTLSMSFPTFPVSPLSGVTITTAAIAWDASGATIQGALLAAFTPFVGPGSWSVAGTDLVAGVDGDYLITAGGAFTGQRLPSLSVLGTTAPLLDTVTSDGSIWNADKFGGIDASIAPISDLGGSGTSLVAGSADVYVSQGTMSSGNIPAIVNGTTTKPTGKWFSRNDTQFLFLHFPANLVYALSPGFVPPVTDPNVLFAQTLLGGLVGPNLSVTTDPCGLLGVLALFCNATPSAIPPSFTGICGLV
jgi:hypothetical protein